jgi:hypothetical protein
MERGKEPAVSATKNGKQQRKMLAFAFLVLLATVIGFILYRSSTLHMSSVPSLKDKWGLLEKKASAWNNDSFLTMVRIDVNEHATFQMLTTYYSPSTRNNLSITIENSGEITVMPISKRGSFGLRPIDRDDWAIDSQVALLAFAEDEIIKSCLQSTDPSKQPIDMTLFMDYKGLAVWRMDIWNCPASVNSELKYYYLDAQTGEFINSLEYQ